MSNQIEKIGKKVIDIGQLVDVFEAQEGEIQHIIGKTGNGKTYEGTRRALEFLKQGYTVYTSWQLILPDFYDERYDRSKVFWRSIFFKKRFYRFDFKKNWKFLDIDRPDLIQFVAGLTDCIVFLDEGQDIFDSRERIDKSSRKVLTRTRHMRKTLIIISQRAQAVDVTARANVTYYYKCVKTTAWYWPFRVYFKVYRTEEMDQVNFPIWEDPMNDWEAPVWQSHFASDEVYKSYNSWYLRAGIPKSQEISFEAYDLNFMDRIMAFFLRKPREKAPSLEVQQRVEEINRQKYEESIKFEPKKRKKSIELSTPSPIDSSINLVSLKHVRNEKKSEPISVVQISGEENKKENNLVQKGYIKKLKVREKTPGTI